MIVTGGIDLSVGSMMGLSAVVLGALWRDAGLPMPVAIALTLLVGVAGGALNALLITRLKLPPLIVTLGTFSLFRGLAEGLTGGIETLHGISRPAFLLLGQGYRRRRRPDAAVHLRRGGARRCVVAPPHDASAARCRDRLFARGRALCRHPGRARLALGLRLSGLVASLAAIIYVAHLGQAKADAGTGYELIAITAVVLGGTSIFGGRGTVHGTLLGLFAIVVLQNGLR